MNPSRLIVGLVLLSACTVTRGQEWSRFRGPGGTGIGNANIPAKWTDKDINWKTELPGGGHSSPVLWGDKIFLTCGNDKTGQEMVVCVNAADGHIAWQRDFDSHTYSHHPVNSYASGSAAVDEKNVYVCWSTPENLTAAALDHQGNVLWRRDLGPFISQHGGGQSPTLCQNLVIITDDQEGPESWLFALDKTSGNIVWKVPRKAGDKFSAATPLVFKPKNGPEQIVVVSKSTGMCAIDPQDGKTIWEVPGIFESRTVASPFFADGLIFECCGDGPQGHGLAAVKPADDGRSAKLQYNLTRGVPYVPTPIVKGDLLFYFTDGGVVTCAKAATGEKVWRERVEGNYFGSPVCVGDKLFCLSKEGEMVVLAASNKFQLLARNPLNLEDPSKHEPPLSTTPAVANGHMYVRTYTHLISVGGH